MAKPPRFYLPAQFFSAETAVLTPGVARHATATLRMRAGDHLVLFDGTGKEYDATLRARGKHDWEAVIERVKDGIYEKSPLIILHSAPIKKERWEWLLEKAVELGAGAVVPLLTRHVEIDIRENFAKKKERWESIIISACEQSGRSIIPELSYPIDFGPAIEKHAGRSILFHEKGSDRRGASDAASALGPTDTIAIFIGPEGGFSEEEVALAAASNVAAAHLGDHVLRAETAALAALSVLAEWKRSRPE